MTDSKFASRAISLLALMPMVLNAQSARQNDVPLKNWAAPLYWEPSQTERGLSGTVHQGAAQLQFSSNAVSTDALSYIAVTPCRLVDTRGSLAGFNGIGPFSGPAISPLGTVTFPVQSSIEAATNTTPAPCGVIPANAEAYSVNLTVVPHTTLGAVNYVSMWQAGGAQPFVATLNDPQGQIVANAAIVPAGTPSGGISVYNAGPTAADVVIDLNGYYAAPTDLNSNTAIGTGSLGSVTSGTFNTAAGASALSANTSGNDNTASGYQSLQNNTVGSQNTANGFQSLESNVNGASNTASGYQALKANNQGNFNTAVGETALSSNTQGSQNTAVGGAALQANTTGTNNTATGFQALYSNINGNGSTATGYQSLQDNTTGGSNTATGYQALQANTVGSFNTGIGYQTLQSNTAGANNTALGSSALQTNTGGGGNTAAGYNALQQNTMGSENTALGWSALLNNTTGGYNIAIGWDALVTNTTGANNIAIGPYAAQNVSGTNGNNIHIGSLGASTDANTIKIGTQGTQTAAYIAGISGVSIPSGVPVNVTSSGQLGIVLSSGRFKEQITDMGDLSNKLLQLRPVSFKYKPEYDDGSHLPQYGLIAEEVAKVYPEMVAYDNNGQVLTIRYQMLTPMLLNEVQKQSAQIRTQAEALRLQQEQNRKLEERMAALEALLNQTAAAK